jgi:hypothetical protein
MEINYLAVVVCAVLSLVVGGIWYGPIFGKKWLEVTGADKIDLERRKEMMAGVWKLYLTQFVLSLFQVYVLAYYIVGWKEASEIENALWIWSAFIIPTIAGTSMWNNDTAKVSWARFLIQGGYQLVIFVIFGLILGNW